MASSKLSALTAKTTAESDDLFYLVDESGATGADQDRKITGLNLALSLFAALEVSTAPATNTSTGSKGQWHWDDAENDLYLCVSANKWVLYTGLVTKFPAS